jgi:hypothetical protein
MASGRWFGSGASSAKRLRLLVAVSIGVAALAVSPPRSLAAIPPVTEASIPAVVTRYAPSFVFHPDEKYWPATAGGFIDNSTLHFNHDTGCGNTKVNSNPQAATLGSGGYRAKQKYRLVTSCFEYGDFYRTNQYTRPNDGSDDRADGLEDDEGFYLDVADSWRKGYRPTGSTSYTGTTSRIYYEYKQHSYIRYWIFYPTSRAGANIGGSHVHEGDWEGVTVVLNSRDRATQVIYSQHFVTDVVDWDEVEKSETTHPVVYVAKGAHASYRNAVCSTSPLNYPKAGRVIDDCGSGRRWNTWKPGNGGLTDATRAPWYGFGGAWGKAGLSGVTTGPLGPSRWNQDFLRSLRGIPDVTSPVLEKPVASLAAPSSRTVNYSIVANDDVAVTEMRIKVSGEDWRPWVPYSATGTVTLPNRYGTFTVWFQVSDAAGNLSSERAADNVTRIAPVVDTTPPSLAKPVASLPDPTSRNASFSLTAADNVGVTGLRVRVNSEAWRPWVDYVASGTVVLPDAYGAFTIWFQVRDAAGNVSFERAADNVTRTAPVDSTPPTITGASVAKGDPASQYATFGLAANDNSGAVTKMRLSVNGAWRDWVPYLTDGTIVLPDSYGPFTIAFQVADARNNVSGVATAGTVSRIAPVSTSLVQVDKSGAVRTCGTEIKPCTSVVKKFRITVSAPITPPADVLVKAWRLVNGAWVETAATPYRRLAMGTVLGFEVTENLLAGKWRFQVQIPVTGSTAFAASDYQFLAIT